MYINPFVAGVVSTIVIELIILVGIAITNTFKNK